MLQYEFNKIFVLIFSPRYGDRSPRSFFARAFSFVWIMIGLVIISIFTATVTTSLTATTLSNEIKLYGSYVST
jgi:membrane protein CcdC involved in cytochrome C biogenesis